MKEISTLFPFFKGNYKGWRDSVRHNLSSYDCFVKVCELFVHVTFKTMMPAFKLDFKDFV